MNLISQHIREGEKEFDEKFPQIILTIKEGMNLDRVCIPPKEVKDFHRSSSLSLVEKIIGEVRGRKDTVRRNGLSLVVTEMTLIKNETLESIALLLEQGLEEIKQ